MLDTIVLPMILNPVNLQIRFLGGKLGTALAKEFDATTVEDLLYAYFKLIL